MMDLYLIEYPDQLAYWLIDLTDLMTSWPLMDRLLIKRFGKLYWIDRVWVNLGAICIVWWLIQRSNQP